MRPLAGIAILVGVAAVFVGLSWWAILQNSAKLISDIRSTLVYVAPESDGTLQLLSHGPVSDWVAAIHIAVQMTILGGIPAAIAGVWLSWRTRTRAIRWSSRWSLIFLGGFVFQLSSILFAPLMFFAFVTYVGDVRMLFSSPAIAALPVGLMLIAVCGAAALRSWLTLLAVARDDALTIAQS